ncbi:hypothetical protein J6O86_05425 [bacterium]|nr:hypothetical protein [bacterium]
MEKVNILKKLLGLVTPVFVCTLLTLMPASADMVSNAGLIPAGFGYTHGRIPVVKSTGRPEIHDAAIMRYDKNSRIKNDGDEENSGNQQGNTYENRQQF